MSDDERRWSRWTGVVAGTRDDAVTCIVDVTLSGHCHNFT
jgi:hypothetical protein